MDKEPIFFDCDPDEERLRFTDQDEAIEHYLDDLGGLLYWPESVTVHGFARAAVGEVHPIEKSAEHLLEYLLEWLDEDYGDPGAPTKPSEEMRGAARVFVKSVVEQYEPWACVKVSEQSVLVLPWVMEHAPHWLEGADGGD